jgi:outer membrane receptor protein involved in Fe transport
VSADLTDYVYMGFPMDFRTEEEYRVDHAKIYGYAQMDVLPGLVATAGLSGEDLNAQVKDRDEFNPKFGITWQPHGDTLVRAAVFRTLHGRTIHSQTIEPTHVSGFNQFFDDFAGAVAWTYGIGIDQKFSPEWYAGFQFFARDLDVPFSQVDMDGNFSTVEDNWKEDVGTIYLYWAPCNWVAIGLDYYYEKYERELFGGPEGIREQTTHRFTPHLNFFHRSGLSGGVRASYIDQEGEFGYSPFYTDGSDRFWVVDVLLRYRLPMRYGIMRLEIKNLFDEQFSYLDTDPAASRYMSERQILASLTVSF